MIRAESVIVGSEGEAPYAVGFFVTFLILMLFIGLFTHIGIAGSSLCPCSPFVQTIATVLPFVFISIVAILLLFRGKSQSYVIDFSLGCLTSGILFGIVYEVLLYVP
jgi:hypothetical protein